MDKQEIIESVNNVMGQNFEIPAEKLTPDALLGQDLGLDSLDAVDMLVHIEDKFKIKVDVEKFQSVKTLDDIYKAAEDLMKTN